MSKFDRSPQVNREQRRKELVYALVSQVEGIVDNLSMTIIPDRDHQFALHVIRGGSLKPQDRLKVPDGELEIVLYNDTGEGRIVLTKKPSDAFVLGEVNGLHTESDGHVLHVPELLFRVDVSQDDFGRAVVVRLPYDVPVEYDGKKYHIPPVGKEVMPSREVLPEKGYELLVEALRERKNSMDKGSSEIIAPRRSKVFTCSPEDAIKAVAHGRKEGPVHVSTITTSEARVIAQDEESEKRFEKALQELNIRYSVKKQKNFYRFRPDIGKYVQKKVAEVRPDFTYRGGFWQGNDMYIGMDEKDEPFFVEMLNNLGMHPREVVHELPDNIITRAFGERD